jgi:hypothetical protein
MGIEFNLEIILVLNTVDVMGTIKILYNVMHLILMMMFNIIIYNGIQVTTRSMERNCQLADNPILSNFQSMKINQNLT